MNYDKIILQELRCSCAQISKRKWEELMKGAVRANKQKIHQLLRRDMPEFYEHLALHAYNPYHYFRTKKHIIVVHSAIEYFISYHSKE